MKISRRNLIAGVALLVIGGGSLLAVTTADAATIPIDQVVTGKATYYNDAGYGACGRSINASNQMLVAVSHTYWTSSNPNNDPLCTGISVQVTYNGKTITVPVEDKCPSCDATHIDLSQPAFAQLGSLDLGVLNGLTWKFVKTGATTTANASSAAASKVSPSSQASQPSQVSQPSQSAKSSQSGQTARPSVSSASSQAAQRRGKHRWWLW